MPIDECLEKEHEVILENLKGENFLEDIEDFISAAIGVEGTVALKKILEKYDGQLLYIPKNTKGFLAFRNKFICEIFDGSNLKEISKNMKLSEVQVRSILKKKNNQN